MLFISIFKKFILFDMHLKILLFYLQNLINLK